MPPSLAVAKPLESGPMASAPPGSSEPELDRWAQTTRCWRAKFPGSGRPRTKAATPRPSRTVAVPGAAPPATTHYRTSTISKESRSIHDELATDPTTAAPRSRSSPRLLRPETARRTRRRCRPPGPGTSAALPPDRLSMLSSGWASVSRPRTVCCPANSVTFRFACLAAERAHGALLV